MRAKLLSCLLVFFMMTGLYGQVIDFSKVAGADKIQPQLKQRMESRATGRSADRQGLRVIVTLKSVEGAPVGKAQFADKAAEGRLRAAVRSQQDRVLNRQAEGDLEVLSRYQTIYGFSAEADNPAILWLAAQEEVERIELMPVFQKMDSESHPLANVDTIHAQGYNGDGITIAIIDDGIDHDHAAFGGQSAWPNAKILGGYDYADNDNDPRIDCTGQSHGTAVAGVAAGNGGGVTGTAPNASLVFLKVQKASECGQPSLSGDVAAAIDWAVANRNTYGIKVISMSLGGGAYSSASSCDNASTAYRNAVNSAYSAGLVVLAASGNEGLCSQLAHPSCMTNVISVGAVYDADVGGPGYCVSGSSCAGQPHQQCPGSACFDTTTSADKVTCYSNSASFLDILAPSNCATTAKAGGGTESCFGGTSSATPFAAGVTASLLEADPSLDNDDIRSILSGTGVGVLDSKSGITKPRVDADAALQQILGGGSNELFDEVPVTGLSASAGQELDFFMNVPSGSSSLVFTISGGTGDADLYVKFGSPPTTSSYDCRPYLNGNNETCSFNNPAAGTWYVMLRAYSSFSGVTLEGDYSSAPCGNCEHYTGTLTGSGDADVHPNGTYYYSGSGVHEGWLEGPAGTDFDLELYRWNGSSWVKVKQSISSTSSEYISYNGSAGYYYWRILSYSGSGSYDFWLDRP